MHFLFSFFLSWITVHLNKGWSQSDNQEQNLGLEGKYLLRPYFWHSNDYGQSKVIRCISDFRRPCIPKMAGPSVKRSKIWRSDVLTSCTWTLFTMNSSRLVWGHSFHFPFSTGLRNSPQLHSYSASSCMAVRYKPDLLLYGKWPGRSSRPMGLLFTIFLYFR